MGLDLRSVLVELEGRRLGHRLLPVLLHRVEATIASQSVGLSLLAPHVGRVVQEHVLRQHWHGVSQGAQLLHAVGEAAPAAELANAGFGEVFAYLGLVVRMQRTDTVTPGEVFRERVIHGALFALAVGKGAHLAEGASAGLLKVTAEGRLVLEPVWFLETLSLGLLLSRSLFLIFSFFGLLGRCLVLSLNGHLLLLHWVRGIVRDQELLLRVDHLRAASVGRRQVVAHGRVGHNGHHRDEELLRVVADSRVVIHVHGRGVVLGLGAVSRLL